jgi:hypothetical protein
MLLLNRLSTVQFLRLLTLRRQNDRLIPSIWRSQGRRQNVGELSEQKMSELNTYVQIRL